MTDMEKDILTALNGRPPLYLYQIKEIIAKDVNDKELTLSLINLHFNLAYITQQWDLSDIPYWSLTMAGKNYADSHGLVKL